MANSLDPDRVRVGHLIGDWDNDSEPIQSATLTFDSGSGAELHIAYLWEASDEPNPQFARANRWFRQFGEGLPKTLVFLDDSGEVTLSGLRTSHMSIGSRPLGRARADVVILGRPRVVRDEYLVKELASTIDGLEEFSRFEPITHEVEYLADGHSRTTILVESVNSVEWVANGYAYAIKSNVAWSARDGRYFHTVDSEPYLLTASEEGASPLDHLAAQWPLRALLVLIHGQPLAWRSHRLRDDEFPVWMLDNSARSPSFVQVQFSGTIQEHSAEKPSSPHFSHPPLSLGAVSSDSLASWVTLYGEDAFAQAVQPAVEVLNGASRFLEPQLMMLAISLDRFGYFLFGDNQRRRLATHVEKCMDVADISWPALGSRRGIAIAVANANNDLKHPDREASPPSRQLAGLVELCKLVARAQVFKLLSVEPGIREAFVTSSNDALNMLRIFSDARLTIAEDGSFRTGTHDDGGGV